jgi:hypothetical protein
MLSNEIAITTLPRLLIILLTLGSATVGCSQSRSVSSAVNADKTLKLTDQWFTLSPNIDEFSVQMPGLSYFIAPAQPNTYIYKHGRSVYSLISFPQLDKNDTSTAEERLDRAGKAFSKSITEYFMKKGRSLQLAPPQKLVLNGVPGLEFTLTDAEDIYVQRLYETDKRLYSLKAIVPVDEKPSAERFMYSFTFVRQGPMQFLPTPPQAGGPYGDPKPRSN